jgi:hypothetical protein
MKVQTSFHNVHSQMRTQPFPGRVASMKMLSAVSAARRCSARNLDILAPKKGHPVKPFMSESFGFACLGEDSHGPGRHRTSIVETGQPQVK